MKGLQGVRPAARRDRSLSKGPCAWVRLAVLLLLLGVLAPAGHAQLSNAFSAEGSEDTAFTLTETYDILVASGIDRQTAEQYLQRFSPDRTFTETEIELIIELLGTGVGPLEAEPPLEVSPTPEEIPPVTEIRYPPELAARILRPFGYDYFRRVPPTLPAEDLTVGPDYVVGIGDQILITLWGDVEQRYVRTVDRQGRLVLPEIGVLMAAGQSLGELREELTALFGQVYRNLRMTVSIGDVRTIQVYVTGDVQAPGSFTLSALSTVFTALYHARGPTPRGSLRDIQLSRRGAELEAVDLYDFLLSGDRNMDRPLQSGDVVHVRPLGPTVQVAGEIRRPGIYEIRAGETLREIIRMAGGMTPMAYTELVTVDRFSETEGTQLFRVDWSDLRQNPILKGGDEVTVYSVFHIHPREYVEIHGLVQDPGTYRLVPGMRIGDLIFRAGGTAEGAYLETGELARLVESVGDSLAQTELIVFPLRSILADPDHPDNLVLSRGDKLFVRSSPGWQPPPVVVLEGEVQFPGGYGLRTPTERISDVIRRAGGATEEAFLKGAQLFRRDEGRVIIDFSRALKEVHSKDDMALEDGDSIFVPRRPETVRVSGAVANPGLLLYVPGKKASFYLERTGGLTEKANSGRVKIVRVTGEIESAHRRLWPDPVVREGDEIRVPEREAKRPVDWGKTLKEAATIIASLTTTVYVIDRISK